MISCVSTGKFKAMQQEAQKNDSLYTWSQRTLKACQDANADLTKQKLNLQTQMNSISLELNASKENNVLLRKQMEALSALSKAQAESVKKSMDNIGAKDEYIQDLRSAVAHRDSVNLVALMNLKAYLGNQGQDVVIKLEKGEVHVDLSDSLLFNGDSTGYTVSEKAKPVLARLAKVLNNQPDIEFMVEGHTDSIPYAQGALFDNWDLSVKRATSVVRILQSQYNVSPARMTAAGRSEYINVASNDTPEGLAANRRTRIIIFPQLDRLINLLERKQGQAAPPATPTEEPATGAPAPTVAPPATGTPAPTAAPPATAPANSGS
jgi:chemotaxis protein MotB